MRRKPYTAIGIRRVPCARCGEPSQHQWNACALGGQFFGVCVECDIGLNRLAITYIGFPDAEQIISVYEEKLRAP